MKKINIICGVIFAVILLTPFFGKAETTVESLQTQIQSLLDSIKKIQSEIDAVKTSSGGLSVPSKQSAVPQSSVSVSSCVSLGHNLYLGLSDGETDSEVSKLQKFLTGTGDFIYPAITGYFGPATEQAVQKWQKQSGIVSSGSPDTTGYGVVGPLSRLKIKMSSCEDVLAKNIPPSTVPPAPTYKPSINISASAGEKTSNDVLEISSGTEVIVSGIPQNLSGNYSRAWFFDSVLSNVCSNNNTYDSKWWLSCKPTFTGASKVYVEIYKDGQTYRSNTLTVNVLDSASKSVLLKASPLSGNVPVKVNFTATLYNYPSCGNGYVWNFGDDTVENSSETCAGTAYIVPSRTISTSHFYANSGSYTASLSVGSEIKKSEIIEIKTPSSIQVLSPNGFEVFYAGKSAAFTWRNPSQAPVDLILKNAVTPATYALAKNVPWYSGDTQPYSWRAGYDINGANVPSGNYYLQVCPVGALKDSSCDMSDKYFAVQPSSTAIGPAITVISPNGRESYVKGEDSISVSVSWNYTPAKLVLYLNHETLGTVYSKELSYIALSDKQTFVIQPDAPPYGGRYRMTVCDEATNRIDMPFKPVCDTSDDYFTIGEKVSVEEIRQSLASALEAAYKILEALKSI